MILFLKVSWVGLQYVILIFPDHTHLLFLLQDPKEEKLKNTVGKYKRPENVHTLQVLKVDQILWCVLDRATRSVDVQLQKKMDSMA